MAKINLKINNKSVEIEEGSTILQAAKLVGVDIPTLCHLPELSPTGACRICVVEIEGRAGVVPACAFPVAKDINVLTHTPKLAKMRKTVVELLLANHPQECLTCSKSQQCTLQKLSAQYGIKEDRFSGAKRSTKLDNSGPSFIRDQAKCILCGRCVRVCEEYQGVSVIDFINRGFNTTVGAEFDRPIDLTKCVSCGQCVVVCPTGALSDKSSDKFVLDAILDPEKTVVVQTAPAVRVAVAEALGYDVGMATTGKMVAALKALGFNKVFDTNFSADLTIMEEASELIDRIKNGGILPMATSCSPGWIRYVEQFAPEFIPNLSTCKSPQQMLGAVFKHVYCKENGIDPKKAVMVSIMPCTAKKYEAQRSEMGECGIWDVDVVLTTRELAKLIKTVGIDYNALSDMDYDDPLGEGSGAGMIFGATGGVMEAALRSAKFLLDGGDIDNLDFTAVRGMQGIKEASVNLGPVEVKVAVANSLTQAKTLLEKIKAGEANYHFVEVMTCPGGCIGGGGQPLGVDRSRLTERMKTVYELDKSNSLRQSHKNESVQKLYKEHLKHPLSDLSHKYLHTHYTDRSDK